MSKLIKRTRTVKGKEITPGMDKGINTFMGDAQRYKYGKAKAPKMPRRKVFDSLSGKWLNDNHLRVCNYIDFYFKSMRYHVLDTGERGDFSDWIDTASKYIKITDKRFKWKS